MTRKVLYVWAGFLAGLIGVLASQFLLLTPLLDFLPDFLDRSELILFPVVSTSLAVAMVGAEIFLNNPTRLKDNWQVWQPTTLRAIGIGVITGLIATGLSIAIGNTPIEGALLKLGGWVAIGAGAGIADGYSWRSRTIEGAGKQRFRQRLGTSILAGSGAGAIAFFLSELLLAVVSQQEQIAQMLGMVILGCVLGIILSVTGAASLCFALKAGAGFELDDEEQIFPRITSDSLRFNCLSPYATMGFERRIEEGISIELPDRGTITIGSDPDCQIFVPILPYHCAELEMNNRQVFLTAKGEGCAIVDGEKPLKSGSPRLLKHNQILTFVTPRDSVGTDRESSQKKRRINFVRFVFYDRFLDPQG